MSNPYSDRTLTAADVYSVSWQPGDASSPWDQGVVNFTLSAPDGSPIGPAAKVELMVRHDPNRTLPDAEKALLHAAHAIIQKLAQYEFKQVEKAYLDHKATSILAIHAP
ncbi:hypothetical protein [Hyphomonas jannaschiana]|uniref:Uncharacterized protein n=1 Tax=Hyphomonas jannaschiana VP2 TaxID=1280952 RepID=A0A059FG90_9PROT|nr:hypothetical protein [Hyphomonas jannaschiana]KCZ89536.1 hypothetical protein HJA_04772 [Hyphomonas jannaschiana VP2]